MCSCNDPRWIVTLATGTTISKQGKEPTIKAFVKRHPGATYVPAPTRASRTNRGK